MIVFNNDIKKLNYPKKNRHYFSDNSPLLLLNGNYFLENKMAG